MEQMDKEMECRVWQRVKAAPEQPPRRDNLKPWILATQENVAAFRNLSLLLIGKQWEGLRRLETESSRMMHSLRGISALRGEPVKLTPMAAPKDGPRRCLEKSFHRSRRLWTEMESRSADPEYGPVFRSLSRKAEDQCAALAEMIGRLEM